MEIQTERHCLLSLTWQIGSETTKHRTAAAPRYGPVNPVHRVGQTQNDLQSAFGRRLNEMSKSDQHSTSQ